MPSDMDMVGFKRGQIYRTAKCNRRGRSQQVDETGQPLFTARECRQQPFGDHAYNRVHIICSPDLFYAHDVQLC